MLRELVSGREHRKPRLPIPLVRELAETASEELAVTWLGHSTALLEIEGQRVLIDPVWAERCSPHRPPGPGGCTRSRSNSPNCPRWTRC
ncbi:MBL fold metallo-hydrolase [Streptacidiphilus monticola]